MGFMEKGWLSLVDHPGYGTDRSLRRGSPGYPLSAGDRYRFEFERNGYEMRVKLGTNAIHLWPFLLTTLVWAGMSAGVIFSFFPEPAASLRVFLVFFTLSVTDLFFLMKTVAALLLLMSDQGAENSAIHAIRALVYGSLKLLCLGAMAVFLWKFSNAPSLGILLGIGTLAVVPLAGGLIWSFSVKLESVKLGKGEKSEPSSLSLSG